MNALRYLPFVARGWVKRGPPLHLTVFVTGRCNARCRHCFHWREVAAGVPGPTAEQIARLADSAARMGPLLWVSFGGGEPFLRNDLAALAGSFARHGLRHLAIPTNGLVEERLLPFVDEVLAAHPELHLAVSVSFDGPPEIHDSIRQVKGGFARAAESVRRLVEHARTQPRLGVGILTTLTSENQHVLAGELEKWVDELHPHNVTLNLARGTAMEPHLLEVDPDRYAELVAVKARLVREKRLAYFDFPLARVAVARDELMYERIEAHARGDRSKYRPCTAGRLSAVVFENGSVQPCEILGRELGNLNEVEWDLERLWNSPAAIELRREIVETRCACTWECAGADNVLFDPRAWPKLVERSVLR